jgi:hypothetical protein
MWEDLECEEKQRFKAYVVASESSKDEGEEKGKMRNAIANCVCCIYV